MNTLTPQERPTLESTTASPQASSKLRLTRRGRLVFGAIGAIAIAGVIAGGALLGPASAEATSVSSSSSFGYVLPAYGDSLWSIAERLDQILTLVIWCTSWSSLIIFQVPHCKRTKRLRFHFGIPKPLAWSVQARPVFSNTFASVCVQTESRGHI